MTITYLVDGYYNPADELGVAWDDPEIGADWGVDRSDPVRPVTRRTRVGQTSPEGRRPTAGCRPMTEAGTPARHGRPCAPAERDRP